MFQLFLFQWCQAKERRYVSVVSVSAVSRQGATACLLLFQFQRCHANERAHVSVISISVVSRQEATARFSFTSGTRRRVTACFSCFSFSDVTPKSGCMF